MHRDSLRNPFVTSYHNGHEVPHVDVQSRLHALQRFTADDCRCALDLPSLQQTVRTALERRLRKLERAQAQAES